MRNRTFGDDGFTLIELLIVLLVLGVLLTIVLLAVGQPTKDSVTTACKSDYRSIDLSAQAVFTNKGGYPPAGGTLGGDNLVGGNSLLNGALLKEWPGGTSA